jgi:hypothetical protein
MSATDVSICSNALLMLGDGPIADFTTVNDRTRLCANLFPQVRDAVLRSHPWNCAVARVALAPDAVTPAAVAIDWAFQFSLPDDWLRTLRVGAQGQEDPHLSEGRKILSDANPLYLRYIFRNEIVASWDAMLVHGVSLLMKAALAYPITKSTSLATASLDDAINYMKTCRAVDGQDDPPRHSAISACSPRAARIRLPGSGERVPKLNTVQTNFTAGEWSPRLLGRTELPNYQNAAEFLENVIVQLHGGARRRDGLRYVAAAKFAAKKARLIPFIFQLDRCLHPRGWRPVHPLLQERRAARCPLRDRHLDHRGDAAEPRLLADPECNGRGAQFTDPAAPAPLRGHELVDRLGAVHDRALR